MPVGDLLPEIALVLGAVATLLLAAFIARQRLHWCAAVALATLLIAVGLAVQQWSMPPQFTFKGVWVLDGPAVFAKQLILLTSFAAVLLSPEWFAGDRRHGEYYALLLFTALGAIVMASAHDAMQLVMGVLLSSAASYPLVAFHRQWAPSAEAGIKYFLLGALANTLLLIGVVLLFGLAGDTDYQIITVSLRDPAAQTVLYVAATAVVAGLCFKLAAFPFYPWMPDVAQGAPLPVAALLSIVPKVGAALALVRFVALLPEDFPWRPLLATIALLTMTIGNLGALWQRDVRRLLGWSSVAQSGYALLAVTMINSQPLAVINSQPQAAINSQPQAVPALLLFLTAYATANISLFAAVGCLRGRTALADFNGLASVRPWLSAVIVIGMLSLVGIPPLVGFFGKLTLFAVTIAVGYAWLAVAALINTVISLFYYLRVVRVMYFCPADKPVHLLGKWSLGVALCLGAATLLLGLAAQVLLRLLQPAVL